MNKNENVTVFLGIYNGEKYLEGLLNQIIKQDSHNFKLLVIDNASTDNSFEIIKNWSRKLENLHVEIAKNPKNITELYIYLSCNYSKITFNSYLNILKPPLFSFDFPLRNPTK
jgi:glycosyltransferase involved in cell wall biosynthesis